MAVLGTLCFDMFVYYLATWLYGSATHRSAGRHRGHRAVWSTWVSSRSAGMKRTSKRQRPPRTSWALREGAEGSSVSVQALPAAEAGSKDGAPCPLACMLHGDGCRVERHPSRDRRTEQSRAEERRCAASASDPHLHREISAKGASERRWLAAHEARNVYVGAKRRCGPFLTPHRS